MHYENYKLEDFLFDEFFVRWIKNPGPETEHFWTSWVEQNPDMVQTINQAKEIISSVKYKNQFEPSEEEYNVVLENILKQPNPKTQLGYYQKSGGLANFLRFAAVLLAIISFAALIVYLNIYNSPQAIEIVKNIERKNPNGVKTTFELDDGTIVRLNAGSRLTFQSVFASNERKVTLEGEAFFIVTRDETRPFIVETKDLITTVLGTSFNVKSYLSDETSSIAVASGKVKVAKSKYSKNDDSQFVILEKDQMMTYKVSDNSINKNGSISDDIFLWKDNIIYFDHSDFSNIVKTLKRWYGVEFIIDENKSFNGLFNAKYYDEPLNLVLEGLKGEYNFSYRISGKNVYIN